MQELQEEIIRELGKNPSVFILDGTPDILLSVKISLARLEKINSGSMQFDHNRYYTFGQVVKFTIDNQKDCSVSWSDGVIHCSVPSKEDAIDIIENLTDYIPKDKTQPDNCISI